MTPSTCAITVQQPLMSTDNLPVRPEDDERELDQLRTLVGKEVSDCDAAKVGEMEDVMDKESLEDMMSVEGSFTKTSGRLGRLAIISKGV